LLKKKGLRATIQPLPGEKLYSVNWNDVPFETVAEELERAASLHYLSGEKPKLNVTLKADEVCLPELFALLDDLLFPQGWVIQRKKVSFAVMSVDHPGREPYLTVDLKELERRTLHEPLQMVLAVDDAGVEAGVALGKKIGKGIRVTGFSGDKLLLGGNRETLRAFVDEIGDHIKK